jgi:hypothetical protein
MERPDLVTFGSGVYETEMSELSSSSSFVGLSASVPEERSKA